MVRNLCVLSNCVLCLRVCFRVRALVFLTTAIHPFYYLFRQKLANYNLVLSYPGSTFNIEVSVVSLCEFLVLC